MPLYASPEKNAVQKTLAAQLLNTAGVGDPITFDDVDGIPNLPGVLVINRVDSNGAATPSSREYISYSGTSGNTVLIETRNVDSGGAARTHSVGSIVEFIPDVIWADSIYDTLSLIVDPADNSALDTTKVPTLTGTQTLTNKSIPLSGTNYLSSSGATISAILDQDNMTSDRADALATQQSIKAYVDNNGSTVNPTPSDVTGSGVKITLTAAGNIAFGDICYIASSGKATLADADAIATSSAIVMALATISADASGQFLLLGVARNDAWNWTVGGLIYLSTTGTSTNTLTQTAPSGTDDVIQIVGVATHADRMFFNPSLIQVEHT